MLKALVPSSSKIKCDSNGYIENFHLKYRKVNTWEEYEEIISSDGSVRMLTITGLLPFTMYEFVLSFNNRDEQSPWSPLTKARTAEDVPSKPRNVELNPAVYTMAVQWLVPDPTNGVINKYIISYWETYNEATTRREEEVTAISQNINRYLITDLTLKVSYTVQVGAHTTAGLGELSDMVSATTTEQDDSNESTSNSLSIIAMVASIIAVVLVVCIGIALVVIVRR
ncbi:ephrin type-B receptor 4b-like [Ptychodera flava]|uniref:ephrin type-B receptor 4b-like n=1 Tax=Ptychodera flava TaxID=63121 RepID=UPI00396A8758